MLFHLVDFHNLLKFSCFSLTFYYKDLADVSGSFESGYSYEVFCKAEELPIFRFTAAPRPMYVEENPWLLSKDRDAREAGRAEYYNKEIVPNLIANGDFKLNFRVQHFR